MDTIQIKEQDVHSLHQGAGHTERSNPCSERNQPRPGRKESSIPQCTERFVHVYRRFAETNHDSLRNSFVKLASYQGVSSTGVIKEVIGINEDLTDRTVVIVEDIVDTGLTMQRLLDTLGTRGPREIHIASLLVKPDKLKVDLNIEYVAMNIPNDFIVGYGLDYDGFGRNYPDIYTVVD